MVSLCLEAARELERHGISATAVNARFVKPLDTALLAALAERCDTFVTVEEGSLPGGFGSAVVEALQDLGCGHVRVVRLGLPDEFVEHGDRAILLESVGLTSPGIVQHVREGLVRIGGQRQADAACQTMAEEARPRLQVVGG
jgi:1-deoxy-D-xylulose-5-phosphate synthase